MSGIAMKLAIVGARGNVSAVFSKGRRRRKTLFPRAQLRQAGANGMNIAIIGLGYVGLPLALQFARSGVRVLGLDIDAKKVSALNAGRSHIKHISAGEIKKLVRAGKFSATGDFAKIKMPKRS